ncbi:probable polygalacturonase At1g80170 [Zingiber officinale]|uniref:probable polygalacturonase At1g80170 n=1 Tax=Zingiber officinale TaxID=94328 RepID=UPI001C4D6D96|nr:probable polygalacturonase At1g80170 [Zingiber officinale]
MTSLALRQNYTCRGVFLDKTNQRTSSPSSSAVSVMVDPCRAGARSSPGETLSRFMSAAAILLLLLLLFDALLCIDARPEYSPSPMQLLRSDHRDGKVAISVDEFGAKGNGLDDDTAAFKSAWDYACSSPIRMGINFLASNVYLINPIYIGGPCISKMIVTISGTIIAPSDPEIWDGHDPRKWIYFHGVNEIVVRGGGTVNGMGHEWWSRSCKRNATNPCRHAPTAITFHRSKHVILQDLNVFNSQQMHVAFTSCSHVRVSRLKVIAPAESPNTDGIHISESRSVVVEGSTISTGDDCISIVGNSSNIQVKGIVCGPGHGISVGSLGKSNSFSKLHHILVEKSLIINTENGLRIKTWQGGSGYARNIKFRNIQMSNVSNPIIIDQYYCDSLSPCENQTSAVEVHDIAFVGIKGTSATENAIAFSCSDSAPCEKILLTDIQLLLESGGNATAYCWKASGSSSGLITPPSCLSSGLFNLIKQKANSIEGSSSPSR